MTHKGNYYHELIIYCEWRGGIFLFFFIEFPKISFYFRAVFPYPHVIIGEHGWKFLTDPYYYFGNTYHVSCDFVSFLYFWSLPFIIAFSVSLSVLAFLLLCNLAGFAVRVHQVLLTANTPMGEGASSSALIKEMFCWKHGMHLCGCVPQSGMSSQGGRNSVTWPLETSPAQTHWHAALLSPCPAAPTQ